MKEVVLSELNKYFRVTERDTGAYHHLRKSGMKFMISSYVIEGFGSMSVIEMSAMLGLMKMESFILTAETKDLPLYNGDYIQAMGRCTLLQEFYDTMISPLPAEDADEFRRVKETYGNLPPYSTEPHWYDSIRYDFTLGAVDKSLKTRKEEITLAYLTAYLHAAEHASAADPSAKKAKTKAYVDGLFAHGGPAVNQFRKLFGEDTSQEIFEKYVFACR